MFQQLKMQGRSPVTGIRVSCQKIKRLHGQDALQFSLGIGVDVLQELKWGKGTRCQLSVGTGDDAGWIQLKPGPTGYKLAHGGKGSRACYIKTTQLAGNKQQHATSAEHKISSGVILIKLPTWAVKGE